MVAGDFVVVIDSREQRPYSFPGVETVISTLETGDYSVLGLEALVAVERKSKADAYQSVGYARDRFEREFKRLSLLDYAAVVIETTLEGFLIPPARTQMDPNSAISTFLSWGVRYDVPICFAGDRQYAAALTLRILRYFKRYHDEGKIPRGRRALRAHGGIR